MGTGSYEDRILSLERSPESVPNNSHPLSVQWAFAGSSHISKYDRRSVACYTTHGLSA